MGSTFWLLYGNGVDSASAFTNPENDFRASQGFGVRLREEIEKAGFQVRYSDDGSDVDEEDFAGLLSFDVTPSILYNLSRLPREKLYLIAFEPPVVRMEFYGIKARERFGKIFIWIDDLVDNVQYFKTHFPLPDWFWKDLPVDRPRFSEKRLCALMNGNKFFGARPNELYTERKRAIDFFSKTEDFDLYGRGWEGINCWKGVAPDNRADTLKNYKFTICYENMGNCRGFIADKIFPVLTSRSIPIYLGATNIGEYIPPKCFIDKRDFSTYDELYRFMKNMSEEEHESYLAAGLDYLQSSKKDLFSVDSVVQGLINQMRTA